MAADNPAPLPRWIKPEKGTVQMYSNFTNASWTLTDISIAIGRIIPKFNPIDHAQGMEVEEQAAVTMSWASAKGLRDMLTNLVTAYEKANGEIKPLKLADLESPIPPDTGPGGQYRN